MIQSKLLLLGLFCLLSLQTSWGQKKQAHHLDGFWEGIITQEDGEYGSEFKFELILNIKGKKVTGRSYAYLEDIYAVMDIKGKKVGTNMLLIDEVEIIDSKTLQDMDWCIKKYQLFMKYNEEKQEMELHGFWAGNSKYGACNPGKIHLRKNKPRA